MNPSKNTIKRLKRLYPDHFTWTGNDLACARAVLGFRKRCNKYATPQHYNIKAEFTQSSAQQVEIWIDSPLGYKNRIEY